MKLAAGFSTKILQARREWQEIFQVMRTRGLQPRLLYPARLSIKIEGQIRSFPDKRSLKENTSTKPALQEMQRACGKERKEKTERGKNTVEGMKSRLDEAEDRISEVEDK